MPVKQADGSEKQQPIGSYYIQKKDSPTGPVISIRSEFEAGPVIQKTLEEKLDEGVLAGTDVERVGSLVGKELATQAALAISLALIFIFVYLSLRFEFAFAAGATLALFHDVLIVPGLVVLFGQQLSVIHIGALLAIAGYSINDTIIVFDRIREVIKTRSGTMRELMNEAISLTLSRTILTSATTLAPMLVLLFFGNPAMLEFALPIAIGVLLYIVTIGLEVHASSRRAARCSAPAHRSFGAEPNTHTCPVCLGLPGALPVLNRAAIEKTLLTGLMLGCESPEI
jgi:SecD/SecF fusion protein